MIKKNVSTLITDEICFKTYLYHTMKQCSQSLLSRTIRYASATRPKACYDLYTIAFHEKKPNQYFKIQVNPAVQLLVSKQVENMCAYTLFKRRTQCRELPLCAGSGEGCQWQALPSPVQCEETATRTRDLPVTSGKTLPLAPGRPFYFKINTTK